VTAAPAVSYRPQATDRKGAWCGCGPGMATEPEAAAWAERCCIEDGQWRTVEIVQRTIRTGSYGQRPEQL
jgi:hypothetical protein